MLKDLKKISEECTEKIQKIISSVGELSFSSGFKSTYKEKVNINTKFYSRSILIPTSTGKNVSAPIKWFEVSLVLIPLLEELLKYKSIVVEILNQTKIINIEKEFDEWADKIRKSELKIDEKFINYSLQEYGKDDTELIIKFLVDYKYWGGGKSIGRSNNDFYHSALMKTSTLLNESSGYVSELTLQLLKFPELKREFEKIIISKTEKDLIDTKQNNIFHKSIKTKPFIILAGISGTGKSRLVRKLAYQFNNIPEDKAQQKSPPSNYQLIKVKPNWHDSSELLGYESRISGKDKYILTDFVKFIVKAWQHPQTPFFLCLDEMNLAPVEQYFAEYLSVIETREVKNNQVQTDALIGNDIFKKYNTKTETTEFVIWDALQLSNTTLQQQFIGTGLTIPSNLIVMGTVNMDETTHSFSRKVLDRAMTIEMNAIDLNSNLNMEVDELSYPDNPLNANLVIGDKTHGNQVYEDIEEEGNEIIAYLISINNKLASTPFQIAYRVRDEFLLYAYNYSLNKSKPDNWLNLAIDNMTCMKILPRIEGDEEKTKVLEDLIELFKKHNLTDATQKGIEMNNRRKAYHYTSFWS